MGVAYLRSLAGHVSRLLHGAGRSTADYPPIDGNCRLYVIGDIHGRDDLLAEMHRLIEADQASASDHEALVFREVYLGDYIDRGPGSADVIERLLNRARIATLIFLRGNHEAMLEEILDEEADVEEWLDYGGKETMLSYADKDATLRERSDFTRYCGEFRERFPVAHRGFLRSLRPSYRSGAYFFVHAGIRPGPNIEAQDESDLYWIREPFLSSTRDHGAIVVHGHTPSDTIEFRSNRIGIDTGAYLTGHLTCLVIDGSGLRVLTACPPTAPN